MITNFKIYENQKGEPQEGDYVILRLGAYAIVNDELLKNNEIEKIEKSIGRVNYIDINDNYKKYNIIIDSVDDYISNMDLWVDREEIVYFSKNIENLKMIKNIDKYNL